MLKLDWNLFVSKLIMSSYSSLYVSLFPSYLCINYILDVNDGDYSRPAVASCFSNTWNPLCTTWLVSCHATSECLSNCSQTLCNALKKQTITCKNNKSVLCINIQSNKSMHIKNTGHKIIIYMYAEILQHYLDVF